MSVEIVRCIRPAELHCRYDGQSKAQPAYIELDLKHGLLLADYQSEVGNTKPAEVRNGFELRYPIPVLTAEVANRVMEEIAPAATRMLADWEEVWDGSNMVARLGDDAQAAEAEIEKRLGIATSESDSSPGIAFDDSDLVTEWDTDGAVNGQEADQFDITADTDDERLDEIAAEITQDLVDASPSDVVVVHGLDGYLRGIRDELAREDA